MTLSARPSMGARSILDTGRWRKIGIGAGIIIRPMMRLILDTNVVLDLLHYQDKAVQPIAAALAAGRITCLADETTLDELSRVLTYPAFSLTPENAGELLDRYRQQVETIPPGPVPRLPCCKDPDDQKFLELAVRGAADLLVSKDKALLHLKGRQGLPFRICTPAVAGELLA